MTAQPNAAGILSCADAALLARALRADLAEYAPEAIAELLGPEAAEALEREQRVPAVRAAREACARQEASILAVQIRALMLREPLPRAELERAFPALAALPGAFDLLFAPVSPSQSVADLAAAPPPVSVSVAKSAPPEGAARPGGNTAPTPNAAPSQDTALVARFQIRAIAVPAHVRAASPPEAPREASAPQASRAACRPEAPARILVASDWGEVVGAKPGSEHVMPVGGATRSLMALAAYAPGRRVLDVGTGCGIHAILAALAGAHVTATDVSPRALGFARLNAAFAGVAVDLREGSLLEPVAGETFDAIVSNPPFVITPDSVRERARFIYRDGGMPGDCLVAGLLGGLREVLAPGGRAWILANWEVRGGWDEPVREWTAGLEAWAMCREELEPARYAEMWLRDGGLAPGSPGYEEAYGAWIEDFGARGVRAVAMGFLLLGAPESGSEMQGDAGRALPCDSRGVPKGPPVFRLFQRLAGPMPPVDALHSYTERVWANRGLASASDAELAALRLRTVQAVEQRLYVPGAAEPFLIKLSQLEGFGEEVRLTTEGAAAIGACDGELTLGEISDAVRMLVPEAGGAPDAPLVEGLGELARLLAGLGMLVAEP